MIEPTFAPMQEATVAVYAHRSLSRAGLVLYLAAQSIVTLGFALLAAWRGIVLAPVFAVLVLLLLAWCLRRVWRSCANGLIVTVTPQRLEVRSSSDGELLGRFHPYWARLRLVPGRWPGWPARLLLGSHGREVEIGAFLNEAERRELAQRLTDLLCAAREHGGVSETLEQGESQ
jgi:uncharacterized membrane protein